MKTKKSKQTIVCGIFAVLLTLAGAVFAQEGSSAEGEAAAPGVRKNAITMDTIPLFKGFVATDADGNLFVCMNFAYERLIAPHFSIGGEIDFYPGTTGATPYYYVGAGLTSRYYPMSEYEKLFLGVNLGFNMQIVDGVFDPEHSGFVGLSVGLKLGYKLLLGKMFVVEPSIGYTYSKTNEALFGTTPQNIGWQAGLRVGLSF